MIGTVLRKPAAQSQTTPGEPSLDELEGPHDVRNLRAVLRMHFFCGGVANSLVEWLLSQRVAANNFW